MKTIKTLLITMAVLLCSITASAHDFEVDGIYYNVTSSANLTVSVTYKGNSYRSYYNEYNGAVIIPSTATYNSMTYSVTSIGESAFHDCSRLTSITIPESVTSIGRSAFFGCSSLTSITIPESVTSIGESAFRGCSSLTSITIPESVTSIGSSAFYGCSSLTSIIVKEGNIVYDSRDNCNAIIETSSNKLIVGCSATIIPESVTSIGESTFSGCSSLTSITIPEGVTSIGDYAFENCI